MTAGSRKNEHRCSCALPSTEYIILGAYMREKLDQVTTHRLVSAYLTT